MERYRTEKISIGWLQVKVKNGKIGTIQRGLAKGGLKQKSSELLHLNTCLVPLCIILSGLGRLSEEWIYVLSNSAGAAPGQPLRAKEGHQDAPVCLSNVRGRSKATPCRPQDTARKI